MMASKYFLHCFRKGETTPDYTMPDSVGCIEVVSWGIRQNGMNIVTAIEGARGRKMTIWESFGPGNRYYIVENHGQCMEPNGDIIWRNEDGAQGDEKAAA